MSLALGDGGKLEELLDDASSLYLPWQGSDVLPKAKFPWSARNVTLDQSQKASVTYRNPKNGKTFGLFYNSMPRDSGGRLPTLAQRPDNVLTLRKKESKVDYRYVFDAKYRINPAYVGTSYREKYGQPGPEEDDINTMHRYRDAIVYENQQTGDFERGLYGAYVLFPYQEEDLFREHRFNKSIKKVNVGAFPFLPNSTELVEEFLDELILDSPEKAYERSTRPRGTETYYEDKLSGKDVLVGSLKDKAQFVGLNRVLQFTITSGGSDAIPLKWYNNVIKESGEN